MYGKEERERWRSAWEGRKKKVEEKKCKVRWKNEKYGNGKMQ
jgi:hypothetical protein